MFGDALPSKWVFGTDTRPEHTAAVVNLHERFIDRLGLSEEERQEVMGKRMARLLGMEVG
jgi:hypothetical protein